MRKTFTFDGKRYDVTAKTAEELAVKVAMKKRDLEEGKRKISRNMTVKAWADQWLATYKAPKVGDATLYAYETLIKKYIHRTCGNMPLKDVKPIHLQRILNSIAGCSCDHLRKIRYLMTQLFENAVENQLLLQNPASKLELPSCTSGTHRAITDVERKYILQVAETHPSGLWVKMMLYCGLRPAETAALQGRHIDLKNRTMKIEGSLKRHTNEIGTTKTAAGLRIVPLPDALTTALKALELDPFEYVFKNQNGQHISEGGMRSRWDSFKKALNIAMGCKTFRQAIVPPYRVADDLVPYCLRHTYCTDLQAAGVPINVAKELMGHANIAITSRIYTHRSETAFANAAEAINRYHSGR